MPGLFVPFTMCRVSRTVKKMCCLALELREKVCRFYHYDISCRFFIDAVYQIKYVPFCACEGILNFSKPFLFLLEMWSFSFILVMSCFLRRYRVDRDGGFGAKAQGLGDGQTRKMLGSGDVWPSS